MAETENEKSTTQHTDAEIGHAQHVQHAPAPAIHLHHDAVAPEAIGGLYHEMPAKYYRSPAFIGTLVVSLRLPTKADNQMLTSPHRPLALLRFLDT
jgi:hypothetical protein